MPVYAFRGRRYDTGGTVEGHRFAQTKQSLAASLRTEKIMPITITEQGKEFSFPWPGSGVSAKEIALFTRQFSVMLDAGLPLVQSLSIMAEQQENRVFQNVLHQVREDVEGGATLSEAMSRHPKVFDQLYTNMIAAGEAGGILDVILQRLAVFVEKYVKLKSSVVSALVYPSVIVLVAVVIVFIIMIWVIPVFATLFEGLRAPLPMLTRMTMSTSAFMSQFAIPIVVAVLLLAVGIRYYYQTEQGRLTIDRLLLSAPLLGPVLRKISTARFSRTLGTLLASGIPILEGMEITARTAGNKVIENALMRARREIEEGKTLVDPMRRAGVFPPMVTQMVGVGEQTGELDQMLQKLADYYEEEADSAIANFLTLLEPVMIVFLGVIIGGIVISMYLPIFTLIGRMSAGI